MAQQILNPNSLAANDKLGDTPEAYTTKINANTTELYTNVATNAQGIIDTAALITGFTKTYWFIVQNTAAAISHTGGATNTYLTNNTLGSETTSYNPDSKDALWNSSTSLFDLSSLKIGDIVNITGYASFNNLAAQETDIFMSVGEGTATTHEHQVNHTYYKTANTGTNIVFTYHFIIKNEDERTGGARFRFASVQAASITIDTFSMAITEV